MALLLFSVGEKKDKVKTPVWVTVMKG